ncbi:MAG: PTS glucose transporter subunit IIA [Oenococcus oeni]
MFDIFTKKFQVVAPISGKCVRLEDVNDEVFSKKMMGDGFAIIPDPHVNIVFSPIDGKIITIPSTLHAVGLKARNGVEILVHIGLDTVNLNGYGFDSLAKTNQTVKKGDPLIRFDPIIMRNKGLDMTTMVIFTNGYEKPVDLNENYNHLVEASAILIN